MKKLLFIALMVALALPLVLSPRSGADARADANDRILMWVSEAAAPGQHRADAVGDLGYMDGLGTYSKIGPALPQSGRIEICGPHGIAKDGKRMALYQGIEGGVVSKLYLVTEGGEPQLVSDNFQAVGCVGSNGILEFSEDGSRLTFIEFERRFQFDFADGTLKVITTDGFTELLNVRNVVAFDQTPNGTAFVSFFTNDRREADEVAVTWWDGNVDRELTALYADSGCRYMGARVHMGPDGNLWMALAQRCSGTTSLNFWRINPTDRSEELIFSANSGGRFSPYAESIRFFFSHDANTIVYTLPDGITDETVSINAYDMTTQRSRVLVERGAVVGYLSNPANAGMTVGSDGSFLAFVVRSVNNRRFELQLWNLDDLSGPVLTERAGGETDTIPFMALSRDGKRLVYVAGGEDNSIFTLDLSTPGARAERVRRGNFSKWAALSPSGNELVIAEYQLRPEGVRGVNFLNTQIVNLTTSEVSTIYTGGRIDGDRTVDVSFAVPVYWYRP